MFISTKRRTMAAAAVILATALLGSVSGVAFATHLFSDVPDTHPHALGIVHARAAGVMTGFPDGTFRPGDPVTRGQAASIFFRGAGRVAANHGSAGAQPDGVTVTAASTFVEAGAGSPATGGYVLVNGVVAATVLSGNCPCEVTIELRDASTGSTQTAVTQGFSTTTGGGFANQGSVAQTGVFPINANSVHNFQVRARAVSAGGANVSLSGDITALYVPMAGVAFEG